jgi:hypothetical protein
VAVEHKHERGRLGVVDNVGHVDALLPEAVRVPGLARIERVAGDIYILSWERYIYIYGEVGYIYIYIYMVRWERDA